MLKSEVSVNGQVNRMATIKNMSDGSSFITFGLRVILPSRQGENMTLDISVSMDGTDTSAIQLNGRIEIRGTLTFKKRGEALYLNLHAQEINTAPASNSDMLTGTLTFRGTIGKTVDDKTDKNGKPYKIYSGFSAEKVGEGFEYTWVRFVTFGENTQIQPKAKIEAAGELELSQYNGKLNISCRTSEVKEWVKPPYNPQSPKEELPF
jgi:hypothetical protein